MIVEEDPKHKVDDETMQTVMLKIMPHGHERAVRAREARGLLLQFRAGFVRRDQHEENG